MLPELMPSVKYSDELASRISNLAVGASNVRTNGAAGPYLQRYADFCNEAARMLTWQLTPLEIERLVLTPTYWRVQSLNASVGERAILDRELIATEERLKSCSEAVRREAKGWPRSDFVVVPDTNVLLQGTGGTVCYAAWHELSGVPAGYDIVVVLLQAVLGELDKHKQSSNKTLRRLSRKALLELDAVFMDLLRGQVFVERERFLAGGSVTGANVSLMVVTDPLSHVRLPDTDSEIIDRAMALAARSTGTVLFVTGDTGAAIRARTSGLKVHKIPTPDPEAE